MIKSELWEEQQFSAVTTQWVISDLSGVIRYEGNILNSKDHFKHQYIANGAQHMPM